MRYVTRKNMSSHAVCSQILVSHVVDKKRFSEDYWQSYLRVPLYKRFAVYTGTPSGFPTVSQRSPIST